MDVSIIIVNWNTADFLGPCLATLSEHIGDLRWEVLIVDNASTDNSLEVIQALPGPVRLIANRDNVGFAAANNQALALARGRYALLLNADTVVRDGTVGALVGYAEAHPEIGIVGGQLFTADGSLQAWAKGSPLSLRSAINHYLFLNALFGHPGLSDLSPTVAPRPMGWVSGCCLLARQTMLQQIGPLSEAFFLYAEDIELCHRAWAQGWGVAHHPGLSITHFQGQSLKHQRASEISEMPLTMLDAFFRSIAPRWQVLPFRLVTFAGLALRAMVRGAAHLRRHDPSSAAAWDASRSYARIAGRILLGRSPAPAQGLLASKG